VIDNAIVGFVRSGFSAPRTGNQRIYSIPVVKDADSYESDGPEPEDLDGLYDEESDVESEEEEHSEYAWFDPDLGEWIEPEDEE